MTKLMEQALDEVRKLPDTEQDAVASLILEQLQADEAWDASFARPESERFLSRLAAEVKRAEQSGEIEPLDPDEL